YHPDRQTARDLGTGLDILLKPEVRSVDGQLSDDNLPAVILKTVKLDSAERSHVKVHSLSAPADGQPRGDAGLDWFSLGHRGTHNGCFLPSCAGPTVPVPCVSTPPARRPPWRGWHLPDRGRHRESRAVVIQHQPAAVRQRSPAYAPPESCDPLCPAPATPAPGAAQSTRGGRRACTPPGSAKDHQERARSRSARGAGLRSRTRRC